MDPLTVCSLVAWWDRQGRRVSSLNVNLFFSFSLLLFSLVLFLSIQEEVDLDLVGGCGGDGGIRPTVFGFVPP